VNAVGRTIRCTSQPPSLSCYFCCYFFCISGHSLIPVVAWQQLQLLHPQSLCTCAQIVPSINITPAHEILQRRRCAAPPSMLGCVGPRQAARWMVMDPGKQSAEPSPPPLYPHSRQVDLDGSRSVGFDEFCKFLAYSYFDVDANGAPPCHTPPQKLSLDGPCFQRLTRK
jgi:hypothetical protein